MPLTWLRSRRVILWLWLDGHDLGLIMAAVVLGTVLAAGTVFFLRASTTTLPPR